MLCLSCGECCKTMSPINGGYCPLLMNENGIFYCSDYENRPEQCINHSFNSNICPIGISKITIPISDRIKNIHEFLISKYNKGLF